MCISAWEIGCVAWEHVKPIKCVTLTANAWELAAKRLSQAPASACLSHCRAWMCPPGMPFWSKMHQPAVHTVVDRELAIILWFLSYSSIKRTSTCPRDNHRTYVCSSSVWCASSSTLKTVDRVLLRSSETFLLASACRCSMQWKITHPGAFSFRRLLNPLFLPIIAAAPSVQHAPRIS